MKNINLFLVSVITLVVTSSIVLSSCGGSSSSSSFSKYENEYVEVAKKIQIISTYLPRDLFPDGKVRGRDSHIIVKVKNISKENLGGKNIHFFIHYDDGSIESKEVIFGEYFEPGDIQEVNMKVRGRYSYNVFTKTDIFEGDRPIKCELKTQ